MKTWSRNCSSSRTKTQITTTTTATTHTEERCITPSRSCCTRACIILLFGDTLRTSRTFPHGNKHWTRRGHMLKLEFVPPWILVQTKESPRLLRTENHQTIFSSSRAYPMARPIISFDSIAVASAGGSGKMTWSAVCAHSRVVANPPMSLVLSSSNSLAATS